MRARRGDPDALESFRAALTFSEQRARVQPPPAPFTIRDARLAGLVAQRVDGDWTQPARYRRALARHLLERKLWDQAVAEWRALAAADGRDAEGRFALGAAFEGRGDAEDALREYRQLLDLAPDHPGARESLARVTGAAPKGRP